jgi:hypothetical protein
VLRMLKVRVSRFVLLIFTDEFVRIIVLPASRSVLTTYDGSSDVADGIT